MASICDDGGGLKRILVICPDGQRRPIRLGRMSMKQARHFCMFIEDLSAAARGAKVIENATADWLADMDDTMHARLEKLRLVKPPHRNNTTLKQLLDTFFEHLNVKPITVLGYQPTRAALTEYFGADVPIRDIEPLRADQWRAKMKADNLAEATISKRVKLARQMFRQAVRWKMHTENPFADVKAGSQMNKARQFFVSCEMADKVLAKCPDSQWKLLFGLSRYGGLRCPSEHLALTWADVDWQHNRIRVTCSKTEHHEGRGERFVPIFPEMRPLLEAVLGEQVLRDDGGKSDYVITRYRDKNANLRTQLNRIIRKAGLTPWPRLFHNLRSTRQTELTEKFPAHVVSAWIGNTERMAQNHYLQVTDTHFEQAVKEPAPGMPESKPEQAAQNPAQSTAVTVGNHQDEAQAPNTNRPELLSDSDASRYLHSEQVAATGLEPVTRGL